MITKMSHNSIYVLDQDSAYDFYVNKLGFEVRTDLKFGNNFRWLTVSPKEQPDIEIILMPVMAGMMIDNETAEQIRGLIQKSAFGAGVFETPDVYATYEELKAKGVEFLSPPKEQPHGIEAIMKDNSGNWFSLTQRKGK